MQETYDQIILLQPNSHPLIALTPHIEEARPIPDVSDLLVLMQMLMKERFDLLLIDIPHLLWRHGNHIAVLVATLAGQPVNVGLVCEAIVEDTELLEIFGADVATRIVEFALVTL